jgi:hypothetical protein
MALTTNSSKGGQFSGNGNGGSETDPFIDIQLAVDSAAAAAISEANADADALATAADVVTTNADVVLTNADAAATAADRVQTGLDAIATAADRVQTGLDIIAIGTAVSDTAADRVQTGLDAAATAADRVQTGLDAAATAADKLATNADVVTTDAAKVAAQAAQTASELALDQFTDIYLGVKAADPTLDNDGNPLVEGAVYFNSVDQSFRIYQASVWILGVASGSGILLDVNNLSDLDNIVTARANLGLGTAAITAVTDYATAAQGTRTVNATTVAVTAGTNTAYTVAAPVTWTSLVDGDVLRVQFHEECGASPTLTVDGLTPTAIRHVAWSGSVINLTAGQISKNLVYELRYRSSGTTFVVESAILASETQQGLVEFSNSSENGAGTAVDKVPSVAGVKEIIPPQLQAVWDAGTDTKESSINAAKLKAAVIVHSPRSYQGWHPYDSVTPFDGNVGVIFDFSVDGLTSVLETPNFEDGYIYKVVIEEVGFSVAAAWSLQVYLESSSSYGGALQMLSAGVGTLGEYEGSFEFIAPRIPSLNHQAVFRLAYANNADISHYDGSGGFDAASGTNVFYNGTSQKILKAKLTVASGGMARGKVRLLRKRDYIS